MPLNTDIYLNTSFLEKAQIQQNKFIDYPTQPCSKQISACFSQRPNEAVLTFFLEEKNKDCYLNSKDFSSVSSAASQSKGIVQEGYSYLKYSFYRLQYLVRQIFSPRFPSLLKREEVSLKTNPHIDFKLNQSESMRHQKMILFHPLFLTVKMNHSDLKAHFIMQAIDMASEAVNHSLGFDHAIQWIASDLPPLQKFNAISQKKNKTSTVYFFSNSMQNTLKENWQLIENKTLYSY